eukprot:jgi/Bigna1/86649/estExt_fgenesh1_pg.C_120143
MGIHRCASILNFRGGSVLDYSKWDEIDTDDGPEEKDAIVSANNIRDHLRNLEPERLMKFAQSSQAREALKNPNLMLDMFKNDPEFRRAAEHMPEYSEMIGKLMQQQQKCAKDKWRDGFYNLTEKQMLRNLTMGKKILGSKSRNRPTLSSQQGPPHGLPTSHDKAQETVKNIEAIAPEHVDLMLNRIRGDDDVLSTTPQSRSKRLEVQSKLREWAAKTSDHMDILD